MDYHLEIVIDGLKSICASQEERINMFKDPECAVDDNFDYIALDSLDYLLETDQIKKETGDGIKNLYNEADQILNGLEWRQEDSFMESNSELVKQWQDRANSLLGAINAHNQ